MPFTSLLMILASLVTLFFIYYLYDRFGKNSRILIILILSFLFLVPLHILWFTNDKFSSATLLPDLSLISTYPPTLFQSYLFLLFYSPVVLWFCYRASAPNFREQFFAVFGIPSMSLLPYFVAVSDSFWKQFA